MGRCMGVLGIQVGGQVRGRGRCCALMGGVRVQGCSGHPRRDGGMNSYGSRMVLGNPWVGVRRLRGAGHPWEDAWGVSGHPRSHGGVLGPGVCVHPQGLEGGAEGAEHPRSC